MTDTTIRRLVLNVPGLIERPYVGSRCCVLPAGDLVADELRSWRLWVLGVDVDADRAEIELIVGDDAPVDDMLEGMHDLGYPAEVLDDETIAAGSAAGHDRTRSS